MGIIHYLGRPDNRTLFELGKFWCNPRVFFGDSVTEYAHYTLALTPHALLNETSLRMGIEKALELDTSLSLDQRSYNAKEMARRIARFANGRSVAFLTDASSDVEDYRDARDDLQIVDAAYPEDWSGM